MILMRFLLSIMIFLSCYSMSYPQETLPVGTHPEALDIPHFPNKVYAVIWRNWNLVPVERMAETLQCSPKDVLEMGMDLGLPAPMDVPASYDKQMYITVVRRNWHLLPYDQLLTLLNMKADELAIALKEDDFLFVKLGNLKPECDPVLFNAPSEEAKQQASEIRKLMDSRFKDGIENGVSRLSFIDSLRDMNVNTPVHRAAKSKGLRYIYSYFGVFGDPLMNPELDPYPDGLLYRLSEVGVNGIWLHVVLNQLVAENGVFPEFGAGSDVRLENLRNLVNRAARHGISVYLYMNEPRAMPVSFFDNHPEITGARMGDYITMCTSTDKVLDWLSHSLAYVFKEVPGLGGVFTITASENLTNCASHNIQDRCTRCSQREYADIIAGVNTAIEEGVHRSAPDAKVIVWDWGWNRHGDGSEIIKKLPKNVWQMSVSEWKTPFERGGVHSEVGEYSISVIGPGPRAQNHWKVAREQGLKTVAKLQINNTWELSAVPWLPVLDLNAEHFARLSEAGLDGYMLSWSLGGYPSPNLELAHMFNLNPSLTKEEALARLSEERYGAEGRDRARQAWSAFSSAFQNFPYDINVMYKGPQQYGPSNLLYANPTNYKSSMVGFPYDDLDGWRGPYSREQLADQFEKVAVGWEKGLDQFTKLMKKVSPEYKQVVQSDYYIAKAAGLHFRSVANQCQFIIARDKHLNGGGKKEVARMKKILKQEIKTAVQLLEIVQRDSRIGFEASNQYYYVPQDLVEKILNCQDLLAELQ